MKRMPYFPLYIDDFIGGTVDLSAEEAGQYIRLLCYQWGNGFIPEDPAKLARIAGSHVGEYVLAKFPVGQDGLRKNTRLEDERAKLSVRVETGKKNVSKRWVKTGREKPQEPELALPNGYQTDSKPIANGIANSYIPDPEPEPYPEEEESNILSGSPEQLADAKEIIDHLNEESGSEFRYSDSTMTAICARLSEKGVTKEGILQMIRNKSAEWKGSEFEKYLRPSTLFRRSNFENYYGARMKGPVKPPTSNMAREINPQVKAKLL